MALADDPFYKNPLDGKPLVARPKGAPRKKRATAAELDFAKRQSLALHTKGYSPKQIAKGLSRVGPPITEEQVSLWLDGAG